MPIAATSLLAIALAFGQAPDPAYAVLAQAYERLRARDYETAVPLFRKAIVAAPARVSIRKDLAYTLLKIGEPEDARDQFGEAMRLDPNDHHVGIEYAFLCYETRRQREARRIFDRLRQSASGDARATAEQAFGNVDRPLADGIARWRAAIQREPDNFSAHHELATLAEQRDELDLAATHYERALRLKPDQRALLLDLGRVWKDLGKAEQAHGALLAASRGAEPRVTETARGLLPPRYPFVYEFRAALELDPGNVELRRELAYLLLQLQQKEEAEKEFRKITEQTPEDLLSAAQLGFLRLQRKDAAGAAPLLDKVLRSDDEDLAARVRKAMGLAENLRRRPEVSAAPEAAGARAMAERSYRAGYMKDALKYLAIAHESDPVDFTVMLKLGYAHNMLHQDQEALKWFALARRAPDPAIAREATRAHRNLSPQFARLRTTAWTLPIYSSRWRDLFSYGQMKTEIRLGKLPVRPYLSMRFAGDTRRTIGRIQPQYLSESAFIFGAGLATPSWRGLVAWGEAGSSVSYLGRRDAQRTAPDYRGGFAFAKGFGRLLGAESGGAFLETHKDGVFVSRFANTFLLYSQNRFGYTVREMGAAGFRLQLCWNANLTADLKRQYWANFAETGPGLRFRWKALPPALVFTVDYLRGAHTINAGNPRGPTYWDLRASVWLAVTR